MEVQLEEEYEDKQKVLREKRELESKLLNAQDQVLNVAPPLVSVSAVKCMWLSVPLLFDWKETAFESREVLRSFKCDGNIEYSV